MGGQETRCLSGQSSSHIQGCLCSGIQLPPRLKKSAVEFNTLVGRQQTNQCPRVNRVLVEEVGLRKNERVRRRVLVVVSGSRLRHFRVVADGVVTVGGHDDNVRILGVDGLLEHAETVFGVGPEAVGVERAGLYGQLLRWTDNNAIHTLHFQPRYRRAFEAGT